MARRDPEKRPLLPIGARRRGRMLSGCAPTNPVGAMSPVLSKPESGPLPQKLLARYLLLLRLYPVLTKAVSRCVPKD